MGVPISEDTVSSFCNNMSEITLDFLQDLLKYDYPDVTIQNFENAPGSKQGDNYTSMVYRITVTGVRKHTEPDGSSEHEEPWSTSIIYKCLPKSLQRRESFKSDELFCNEVAFYTKIWPAFANFQSQWPIHNPFKSIPKYYLAQNDCVVLKDLKRDGYVMADRRQGLSLEQCYLVLKNLSHFHAISLAMKVQDPEGFYELLKDDESIKEIFFVEDNIEYYKNYYKEASRYAILMVDQELSGLQDKDFYLEKMKHFCAEERFYRTMMELVMPREPLAVVCHGDCWTNNFMFKYVDGDIADMYLLDFQLARYSSPTVDLYYVLYLCLEREVRSEHLSSLLEYYCDELHRRVRQMTDGDTIYDTSLTKKVMQELIKKEWKRCGQFALGISLDMIPIMTCDSDEAPNVYQSEENTTEDRAQPVHTANVACRRKMTELLVELVDSGVL